MITLVNNTTYLTIITSGKTYNVYYDDIAGFTKESSTSMCISRKGNATASLPASFTISLEWLTSPVVVTIDGLIAILYTWKMNMPYQTGSIVLVAEASQSVLFAVPFASGSSVRVEPIIGADITNVTATGFDILPAFSGTVSYFAILNS